MDKKMQIFVKIEDFKDITEILNLTRQRLQHAKALLARIAELKAQEDAEFEAWMGEINEIERRVETVDKSLLGREEAQ